MLNDVIQHYLGKLDTATENASQTSNGGDSVSGSAERITQVLPSKNTVLPLQASPHLDVTPVIPVTPENRCAQEIIANALKPADHAKLLSYLDAIGETDQHLIQEFLTECGSSAEILGYALLLAEDTLRIRHGDTQGFVRCGSCRHLHVHGQRCTQFGWWIVVDKWRRCRNFEQR